jgi:hypothetical protein
VIREIDKVLNEKEQGIKQHRCDDRALDCSQQV